RDVAAGVVKAGRNPARAFIVASAASLRGRLRMFRMSRFGLGSRASVLSVPKLVAPIEAAPHALAGVSRSTLRVLFASLVGADGRGYARAVFLRFLRPRSGGVPHGRARFLRRGFQPRSRVQTVRQRTRADRHARSDLADSARRSAASQLRRFTLASL